MSRPVIAVIGGSGLYHFSGLTDLSEHTVETPFGPPSSPIISGTLDGTRMLFLTRHGKGHRYTPSEVNYRANIFALKLLGAQQVISVSAVGSMREDIHPGDLVVVDQYIDRTKGRPSTFFGNGIVGHVMFADPACQSLCYRLYSTARDLDLTVHHNKTLMVMEGPAFSTRAESNLHRQLGVDLIGMTAMPEAKLAREAELCYATLAMATDYDCWHEEEEDVTVEAVLQIMKNNVSNARAVIEKLAADTPDEKLTCPCGKALEFAIMTDRNLIPGGQKKKMAPLFGRVL